jgi:penicillin-binding protein 2
MSSEPSIFFSDVNERQGSFLRRTFVLGGLTTLGFAARAQTVVTQLNDAVR